MVTDGAPRKPDCHAPSQNAPYGLHIFVDVDQDVGLGVS